VLDTDRPERWTTPLRDVVQSANVGDRAIVSNHTATHYSGNGSYRLTDQAITECPSQCRWLMCTNADNRYHPEALSIVDHEFDVVSMDENRTMQNRTATWLRASLPMDGGGRSWGVHFYRTRRMSGSALFSNNILTDDVVQRLGRCHMVAERMSELRKSPRAPTAAFS